MILEKEYKDVKPLDSLIPEGVVKVLTPDAGFTTKKRIKTWKLKEGVKPESVGMLEMMEGMWTFLFYQPDTPKGLVKDANGEIVRMAGFVTEDELYTTNIPNDDFAAAPGVVKGPVPSPHRKLNKNETLMKDGPFGGYMVVDPSTAIPQEVDKMDQILNTVLLIKELVSK
jgi:hypothetical protein